MIYFSNKIEFDLKSINQDFLFNHVSRPVFKKYFLFKNLWLEGYVFCIREKD